MATDFVVRHLADGQMTEQHPGAADHPLAGGVEFFGSKRAVVSVHTPLQPRPVGNRHSNSEIFPMRLKFLTAAVIALTTPAADAGPIRDRLRARFGGCQSCQSCQQSPQAAFPATAPVAASPAVTATVAYTLPAAPTCVNGSCAAAPVTVRRGLFR